jgi:hypothetical protein
MAKRSGQRNIVRLHSVQPKKTSKNVVKNGGDFENIDSSLILQQIQKKVSNSSALNGGFDVLLVKIENIEESQNKLVSTVGSIHNAIYNPDDGLFSRISSVKFEDISKVEQKVVEIENWKNSVTKSHDSERIELKETAKKVDDQQVSISNIENWKKNVNGLGKWFLVAIGGGIITMTFNYIFKNFF